MHMKPNSRYVCAPIEGNIAGNIVDNLLTKNAVVHSAWKMALNVKRPEFFHCNGERQRGTKGTK